MADDIHLERRTAMGGASRSELPEDLKKITRPAGGPAETVLDPSCQSI